VNFFSMPRGIRPACQENTTWFNREGGSSLRSRNEDGFFTKTQADEKI
jgi:hypothetical protein